ncbi:uncharacterized protein PHACADRAFT_263327 [Phanerochaete carnosa HHB-10118-sp]|uniref:Protein kinase domain-containing protein n=1 Tax=Phanerochaete carnosa (strain HHB-10118-sp) TaxID=650164 RepID=K5VWY9_PHACS|nr:uncharacterized protein PHACADRAFT_263327 [Phanerochaete carnosa HHB-10118-sp]EKM51290.1 hypothetical protein PHACADRAFT_263327 [Phanerochaete carnosa HHB-10118-sp]
MAPDSRPLVICYLMAAVNAFATFADCSNVPAITELSKTLQAFQQRLKYSKYCKKECTALANKCGDWAQEFEEWAKVVDNTELAEVASEQSMRFEDIMLRVTKISSRLRWKLLWGAEKVKRELNTTRATMSGDATVNHVLEKGQENLALTRELKADLVQARAHATPSRLSKSEGEQKEFEAQAGKPSQVPTPNATKMNEPGPHITIRNITLPEIRSAVADYEKRTGVRSVVPDLKDEIFVIKAPNGQYKESTGNARTQIHIGNYKGRRVSFVVFTCSTIRLTSHLRVVVRRYVVGVTDIDELRERFLAETLIWGQFNHPPIHRFFGVTNDTALAHTVIVSEWEDNGNAVDYITKRPGDLAVRLRLLIGAAEGLIYLHGLGIVHGNRTWLYAGEALITGFQRGKLDADTEEDKVVSTRREFDTNWTAPDLADAYRRPCAKLDAWAFGMIMYELLSGREPYDNFRGGGRILKQITIGVLPERPLHALVTDELWELMGDTWNQKPEDRPNMEQVLVRLRALQATNDLQDASS